MYLVMRATNPERLAELRTEIYYILAANLRYHGAYSLSAAPPYAPHSAYTPLFPIFLAPLVASLTLVHLFQWLANAALAVATFRLARRVGVGALAATLGAVVFALEPYHVYLSNLFYSEILLTLLTLLALKPLLDYLETRRPSRLAVAALLLGLATLTRPVTLPLLLLIPAAAIAVRPHSFKIILRDALVGLVIFAAVLSPELIRNYRLYRSWSLSSLAATQMLRAALPHYLEWREEGRNASEAGIFAHIAALQAEASTALGWSVDIQNNYLTVEEADIVTRRVIRPILAPHLFSFAVFAATQAPFELMTDNWRMVLESVFRVQPAARITLAAALAAARGGPGGLLAVFRVFDLHTATFALGKIFWAAAYLLALVGLIVLWRKKVAPRFFLIVIFGLILYYPVLQLPYLEARYRFPGTPYVFIFAAAGAAFVAARFRRNRRSKEAGL